MSAVNQPAFADAIPEDVSNTVRATRITNTKENQMIVFQNPGLIDMDAVTTMGVSVKEGDSPIGFFGTGLKFAIATILRNGCSITIFRGRDSYSFTAEERLIRGEQFQIVCMNGEALGFTTMLGRNWEPWMAFRELASNCRDEGGAYTRTDEGQSLPGHTTIVVRGKAMVDVWAERETILLGSEPLLRNDFIEVRSGPSQFVYFRGVRVFTAPRPLSYTYNVLDGIELTEDRSAKTWWSLEYRIEKGVAALSDRAMLRRILTCGELYAEHHMNFTEFTTPGAAFREVAREIGMGSATENNANPNAVSFARTSAIADMQPGDGVALDQVQARMLEKATTMLEAGGFKVSEFPLIACETLGPSIHGMAKDGKIFLSLLPFEKGTREVAATLLEEFAHLKSGQTDCTRGFQNWLFDQLLVRAERASGEPF